MRSCAIERAEPAGPVRLTLCLFMATPASGDGICRPRKVGEIVDLTLVQMVNGAAPH
jgi:hypothetical protein